MRPIVSRENPLFSGSGRGALSFFLLRAPVVWSCYGTACPECPWEKAQTDRLGNSSCAKHCMKSSSRRGKELGAGRSVGRREGRREKVPTSTNPTHGFNTPQWWTNSRYFSVIPLPRLTWKPACPFGFDFWTKMTMTAPVTFFRPGQHPRLLMA